MKIIIYGTTWCPSCGSAKRFFDDKNLCLKMGEESRKLFLQKFLLEDKICEHEKLYDQLVIDT